MTSFKKQMAATYAKDLMDRMVRMPEYMTESAKPFPSETNLVHLVWMCNRIISLPEEMSETKLNRWIGYVQGVLACKGLTTVEYERHNYLEIKEKLLAELNRG